MAILMTVIGILVIRSCHYFLEMISVDSTSFSPQLSNQLDKSFQGRFARKYVLVSIKITFQMQLEWCCAAQTLYYTDSVAKIFVIA